VDAAITADSKSGARVLYAIWKIADNSANVMREMTKTLELKNGVRRGEKCGQANENDAVLGIQKCTHRLQIS
jgi:hypothetical protein